MVAGFVALAIVAASALAEWLHARRSRRLAHLAFGPRGRARGWVRTVAPLRVVAAGAIGWGLTTLIQFDADHWAPAPNGLTDRRAVHHLVLALDVSPSMDLEDAGPKGKDSRADRARDVLRSILDRLDLRRTRVSIIAFYSKARPVVVDTFDANVVTNILQDLPLEHAFAGGKTSMYQAVATAGEIGKKWRADSATLVLVSDGDTLPARSPSKLPISYSNILVLGVGNPRRGQYIDDHNSRQDTRSLESLALRLGGQYNDVNTRFVSTQQVTALAAGSPIGNRGPLGQKDVAIAVVFFGAVFLGLVGPLLALAGGAWSPARAQPEESYSLSQGLSTKTA